MVSHIQDFVRNAVPVWSQIDTKYVDFYRAFGKVLLELSEDYSALGVNKMYQSGN